MNALANGLTPKMRPLSPARSTIVSALDVGSTKVACLIARLKPRPPQDVLPRRSHSLEVLGFGHTRARGVKAGTVINLAEAEESVRTAVAAAERMAGLQVESVIASIAAGRIGSNLFSATVPVVGATVADTDIERVLAAGSRNSVRDGRLVLHSLPIGHSVDDARGIRDPRGMVGGELGVDMHLVTLDRAPAHNLMLGIERCHLGIEAMVAAPFAGGLAALTDDEADLGAAVIDMGAGTTTLALFCRGEFMHADGFALGGHHVTMDLARGLSTRIADAERIKTLYGGVLAGVSDDRDTVTVPSLSDEEREPPHIVQRSTLVRIIKPRVEEILEMVRDRLAGSPFAGEPQGRIVLTGGASQLTGMADLAARVLSRAVRIGRPLGVAKLPDAAKGPAFAAAAGLLIYPQLAYLEHFEPQRTRQLMTGTDGYFARVGRWFRESF